MRVRRYDSALLTLPSPERDPHTGFARIWGLSAREGVLVYRNADGSERRELRLWDQLALPESLDSMQAKPVVGGEAHVKLWKASDIKPFLRGAAPTSEPVESERAIKTCLDIFDGGLLDSIDDGATVELSWGYEVDIDEAPGEWNGISYTHIQRGPYTYNHLAVVEAARGGETLALRLDSAADPTAIPHALITSPGDLTQTGYEYSATDAPPTNHQDGGDAPPSAQPHAASDHTPKARYDGADMAADAFKIEEDGTWNVRDAWSYQIIGTFESEEEADAHIETLTQLNAEERNAEMVRCYKDWKAWNARYDAAEKALGEAQAEAAKASGELLGTKARLDAASGRVAVLEAEVAKHSDEAIEQRATEMARERLDAAVAAAPLVKAEERAGLLELSTTEIKAAAIKATNPSLHLDGASADFIDGAFQTALGAHKSAEDGLAALREGSAPKPPSAKEIKTRLDAADENGGWEEEHRASYHTASR